MDVCTDYYFLCFYFIKLVLFITHSTMTVTSGHSTDHRHSNKACRRKTTVKISLVVVIFPTFRQLFQLHVKLVSKAIESVPPV